jgi:hypothetical protein
MIAESRVGINELDQAVKILSSVMQKLPNNSLAYANCLFELACIKYEKKLFKGAL